MSWKPWDGEMDRPRLPPLERASPHSRADWITRAGSTSCRTATCSLPKPTRPRGPRTARGSRDGSSSGTRRRRAAPCRAPTASRSCATPTVMVSPRRARSSRPTSIRRSAWRSSATRFTSPTPTPWSGFRTRTAPPRHCGPAVKVADLPGGALNHHWTKSLIASRDGSKLYVGVGSNSNVAENGIEQEEGRAAVWEIDLAHRRTPVVRVGPAKPGRHGLGGGNRRALGLGQRAR